MNTDHAPSFAEVLEPPDHGVLRAMTLNIVHGTRVSLPSSLFTRRFVLARLTRIAHAARAARVDVLALQEADGDARFDRSHAIARTAGLATVIAPPREARHGATLLARAPLAPLSVHRFAARALDAKGFVLARTATPDGHEIDVASIHLHALSRRVRSVQIDAFVSRVRDVHRDHGRRPLVVLGDLNDDFEGSARELSDRLALHTVDKCSPTYTDLGLRLRLDWVLASHALEITQHRVLAPGLSDHRAIVADVRVRRAGGAR